MRIRYRRVIPAWYKSTVDIVSQAHRTRLWRIGPLSLISYVLHPTQYHPRQRLHVRLHLRWRTRCVEMTI